jgi:hypothetical protein
LQSFHHRRHELTVGGEGRYQKESGENAAAYPYDAGDDVNQTKNEELGAHLCLPPKEMDVPMPYLSLDLNKPCD